MLFDNKAVWSSITGSHFEENNGIHYDDLKVEIYEYCTLLCYFKQVYRNAMQTMM